MSRRSSRLASAAIQQPAVPAIVKSPPKSSKRPKPPTTPSPPSSIRGADATKASSATDMPTLPFADSHAFRAYMIQAGRTAPGVWLRIAKKSTAIPTVTYDEAIDEALCCGWIDGQRRRDALDARYFLQRFTPRRRRSVWSQRNVDKVAALAAAGRMLPPGRAEVDAARADGRWDRAYAGSATVQVPADFRAALEARPNAAAAFDALSRAARYPFLHRLQTVKKEETRTRKMAEFVELLDRGETL